jgi:hypothetical protein
MKVLISDLYFCLHMELPLPVEEQWKALTEHCVHHLGTNDRRIIEDTIVQLERTIRTIQFMQNAPNPPLTQAQDYLTKFRKSAYNHRHMGEYNFTFHKALKPRTPAPGR